MFRNPQQIKRKYKKQEFEQVERGERAFDLHVGSTEFEIEEGDLVTLVEVDDAGEPTGRELTRRVSVRLDTDEMKLDREDVAKHGLVLLGLNVPEYRTLGSILNYGFIMSVGVDCPGEGKGMWELVGEPSYTPILTTPDFVGVGVLEQYGLYRWPPGRYSITAMLTMNLVDRDGSKDSPEDGYWHSSPVKIDIIDSVVLTYVKSTNGDGTIAVFEELRAQALANGDAISVDGNRVTPIHPDEIDDYIDVPKTLEPLVNAEAGVSSLNSTKISMEELMRRVEDSEDMGDISAEEIEQLMLQEEFSDE